MIPALDGSPVYLDFPTMRLAVPVEELALRSDVLTGGLAHLPLAW
ncbi:hypothetical protein [Streptomyces sp. NRRL F-4474]|nr:hypothetical protein [Streptomyces sp. NRRL F-4474]